MQLNGVFVTKSIIFMVLLIFIIPNFFFAQINFRETGLVISSSKNNSKLNLDAYQNWCIYPKIYFEGNLFRNSTRWNLWYGFIDDGIEKGDVQITDSKLYGYSSHNIGIQFKYIPKNNFNEEFVFLKFLVGFSSHFVNGKYLSGSSELYPNNFDDQNVVLYYLDGGVNIVFNIHRKWKPFIETEYHFPFADDKASSSQLIHIGLGIGYNIN